MNFIQAMSRFGLAPGREREKQQGDPEPPRVLAAGGPTSAATAPVPDTQSAAYKNCLQNADQCLKRIVVAFCDFQQVSSGAERGRAVARMRDQVHVLRSLCNLLGLEVLASLVETSDQILAQFPSDPEPANPSVLRTLGSSWDFLRNSIATGATCLRQLDSPPLVLLLDSDHVDCEALALSLRCRELKVVLSHSGEAAASGLHSHPFELVIADVTRNDLEPRSVLNRVREVPGYVDTPAIFLTGLSDFETQCSEWTAAGVECVGKPFSPHELIAKAMMLVWSVRLDQQNCGAFPETPPEPVPGEAAPVAGKPSGPPRGVICLADDGTVKSINRKGAELLGYVQTDLAGCDLATLFPDHLQDKDLSSVFREPGNSNRPVEPISIVGLRADGQQVPFSLKLTKTHGHGTRLQIAVFYPPDEQPIPKLASGLEQLQARLVENEPETSVPTDIANESAAGHTLVQLQEALEKVLEQNRSLQRNLDSAAETETAHALELITKVAEVESMLARERQVSGQLESKLKQLEADGADKKAALERERGLAQDSLRQIEALKSEAAKTKAELEVLRQSSAQEREQSNQKLEQASGKNKSALDEAEKMRLQLQGQSVEILDLQAKLGSEREWFGRQRREQAKRLKEARSRIQEYEAELGSLRKVIEADRATHRRNLEEATTREARLAEERDEARKQLESLQEQVEQLRKELDAEREQRKQLSQDHQTLEEARKTLKVESETLRGQFESWQKESETLFNRIKQLRDKEWHLAETLQFRAGQQAEAEPQPTARSKD